VGSALIKVVQQADDPVAAAAEFVHKIKAAL